MSGRGKSLAPTVAVVVVAIVLVALSFGVWFQWFRDTAEGPETVALPEADHDLGAVASAFDGGGLDVLRTVVFDIPLLHGDVAVERSGCQAAADELNEIATPDTLAGLVDFVDDPATRDMVESFLGEAVEFVGSCASGADPDPADLHFTSVVLRRRLEQIGVAP